MLPAFPTGRQCTSGASPRASTISKAAVFWPCSRSGFTELTSSTGYSLASLRASSRQSSKLPSTCSSFAPCTSACASFPSAILPRGTRTAHVRPARAAYAAALALVLPVEAQMTAVAPRAAAMLTATVMPRSLNDPVGLAPSTFRYTSHPVRADTTGAGSSGVAPSPSVITGVPAAPGSRSRYCLITPGQVTLLMATLAVRRAGGALAGSLVALPFHAHHAGDRAHHVHRAEVVHAAGERGVRCRVGDDDQLGVLTAPFLPDRLDGHLVPGERLRHPGQHPRPVGHVERDVVAGQRLPHGQHLQARVGSGVRAAGPGEPVARHRDDVAEHRARGRHPARPPAGASAGSSPGAPGPTRRCRCARRWRAA